MDDLGLFFLYLGGKPSDEYRSFESSFDQAVSMASSWANERNLIVEIFEFQGFKNVWVQTIQPKNIPAMNDETLQSRSENVTG